MTELQLALDFMAVDDALVLAAALGPLVDRVEAGTPLIKRAGCAVLAQLRTVIGPRTLVADLKTMDAGAFEADLALDAGADVVTVLACAGDNTIRAMVAAAHARGAQVMADLMGVADLAGAGARLAALGVDALCLHTGADDQASGQSPLYGLAAFRRPPGMTLAVAGGIGPATIDAVLAHHPDVVIVGGAITGALEPVAVARQLRVALNRVATA